MQTVSHRRFERARPKPRACAPYISHPAYTGVAQLGARASRRRSSTSLTSESGKTTSERAWWFAEVFISKTELKPLQKTFLVVKTYSLKSTPLEWVDPKRSNIIIIKM
jgi:hypothetical protein